MLVFLGHGLPDDAPNNSFKPTPHRGVNSVLYATLHAVATPPWGGLTQALGLMNRHYKKSKPISETIFPSASNTWVKAFIFSLIPCLLLLYQINTNFNSAALNKLLFFSPLIGIFGTWYFLNLRWWLKTIFSITYALVFLAVGFLFVFGSACQSLADQGRSCI